MTKTINLSQDSYLNTSSQSCCLPVTEKEQDVVHRHHARPATTLLGAYMHQIMKESSSSSEDSSHSLYLVSDNARMLAPSLSQSAREQQNLKPSSSLQQRPQVRKSISDRSIFLPRRLQRTSRWDPATPPTVRQSDVEIFRSNPWDASSCTPSLISSSAQANFEILAKAEKTKALSLRDQMFVRQCSDSALIRPERRGSNSSHSTAGSRD